MVIGQSTLDFHALETSARYEDGYSAESQTVQDFWRVLHGLSDDQKHKFLKFVTGSDRVPIRGLSAVKLVISRAGTDSDRLPSAHTCFDHMLIPDYRDFEKLKTKLLLALEHAEGFGTQ
jgi:ubiquitin-protein ligase E3 A